MMDRFLPKKCIIIQEYRMDCRLCGTGDDSVSVMPRDPRKSAEW